MYYVITATVVKTEKGCKGFTIFQVPTFFLNASIQGITDTAHAVKIATEVINPTKDPNVSVEVDAILAD